ncbi:nucleotide-binding universal stress UspA family protein [Vreelandella songnenensis]|uniref:Nucleotide-binding universal stress UspA family protein n=1 Tax=Vreelandella songnenensis TaxID=1176243 RepID=A0A2T0V943_9GAMM|nr:universal stress protein [Halomonas songnenensis]PRY66693.1 nucleotide-binding universal stress UspA family protein [Halomonas songnenensis]
MTERVVNQYVVAAIDGSRFSEGVCDYAAWASLALDVPLTFVHVVDNHSPAPAEQNLSGNLHFGAREHLLEELSTLDEQRAKVNREQGRLMLEAAQTRASEKGVSICDTRQLNGTLVETLVELEEDVRLLIMGKRGETAHQASDHLGANLERVVREMHRPILMVPPVFKRPEKILIAFDGSKTTRKGVEMLARSPLFTGIECHVLVVGVDNAEHHLELGWALGALRNAGHRVEGSIRAGKVDEVLQIYTAEQDIDLLVMGAYGHSRIRHLLIGSTTTAMLRGSQIPVLILR